MVAAGWVDGRWAVAACFDEDGSFGGGDGGGTRAGSFGSADDGTCADLIGGRGEGGLSAFETCLSAVDVATGDTGGMGPALHIVHQVLQERDVDIDICGVGKGGDRGGWGGEGRHQKGGRVIIREGRGRGAE